MNNTDNPLVSFNTYETLCRIHSMITFLESYYCLNDIQGKNPPKNIDEEVYTGLYYVLSVMGQAVAFEMERIQNGDNKSGIAEEQ